jgi:hypothetical protein
MGKLKKMGEIRCYGEGVILEVVKILENNGFIVVDDDEGERNCKTYHILKDVQPASQL